MMIQNIEDSAYDTNSPSISYMYIRDRIKHFLFIPNIEENELPINVYDKSLYHLLPMNYLGMHEYFTKKELKEDREIILNELKKQLDGEIKIKNNNITVAKNIDIAGVLNYFFSIKLQGIEMGIPFNYNVPIVNELIKIKGNLDKDLKSKIKYYAQSQQSWQEGLISLMMHLIAEDKLGVYCGQSNDKIKSSLSLFQNIIDCGGGNIDLGRATLERCGEDQNTDLYRKVLYFLSKSKDASHLGIHLAHNDLNISRVSQMSMLTKNDINTLCDAAANNKYSNIRYNMLSGINSNIGSLALKCNPHIMGEIDINVIRYFIQTNDLQSIDYASSQLSDLDFLKCFIEKDEQGKNALDHAMSQVSTDLLSNIISRSYKILEGNPYSVHDELQSELRRALKNAMHRLKDEHIKQIFGQEFDNKNKILTADSILMKSLPIDKSVVENFANMYNGEHADIDAFKESFTPAFVSRLTLDQLREILIVESSKSTGDQTTNMWSERVKMRNRNMSQSVITHEDEIAEMLDQALYAQNSNLSVANNVQPPINSAEPRYESTETLDIKDMQMSDQHLSGTDSRTASNSRSNLMHSTLNYDEESQFVNGNHQDNNDSVLHDSQKKVQIENKAWEYVHYYLSGSTSNSRLNPIAWLRELKQKCTEFSHYIFGKADEIMIDKRAREIMSDLFTKLEMPQQNHSVER